MLDELFKKISLLSVWTAYNMKISFVKKYISNTPWIIDIKIWILYYICIWFNHIKFWRGYTCRCPALQKKKYEARAEVQRDPARGSICINAITGSMQIKSEQISGIMKCLHFTLPGMKWTNIADVSVFMFQIAGHRSMFCYHCPPSLHPSTAPRLPSLDYPFTPTHPCK